MQVRAPVYVIINHKIITLQEFNVRKKAFILAYTLPAEDLAPSELLCSISYMLNQTSTSINKLYIF
jgi:hypothetical protein